MASSEVEDILASSDIDDDTVKLANRVAGLENSLETVGLDPGEASPRQSLIMKLLDTLDAPRQGIAGIFDTIASDEFFANDPITGENIGTGFRRGQIENTTFSDILRKHDLESPVARGAIGLAGDILMDPLSYLSFGAGAGAKVGASRVLTEAGQAVRGTVAERIAKTGVVDVLAQNDKLDEVFRGIERYQDLKKQMDKLPDESPFRSTLASLIERNKADLGGVIDHGELPLAPIFEENKLRVGINLPGQVEKPGYIEEVLKSPSPVGQAMRDFQDKLGVGFKQFAAVDIAPTVKDAMDNISLYSNHLLNKAETALKNVPILGAAPEAARVAATSLGKAYRGMQKIFNQAALTGRNFNDKRLDYLYKENGARELAAEKTVNALGDKLLGNRSLQKEVVLALDSFAKESIKPYEKAIEKRLLPIINDIVRKGDFDETVPRMIDDVLKDTPVRDLFNQNLANFLANPSVPAELREGVQRTVKAMDDIFVQEADKGIRNNFISAYIPHKYKTMNSAARTQSGKAVDSFTKERKYNTLSEAFNESGKVADKDLPELLFNRHFQSSKLQMQKNFFTRSVIENGMPLKTVQTIYKTAMMNPMGPEAELLRSYQFQIPRLSNKAKEMLAEGTSDVRKQAIYKEAGESPDNIMRQIGPDFQQKTHEELWAAGAKPLDSMDPKSFLAEMGEEVSVPGMKEPMFLPKAVANAYKETVAARDYIKDTVGKTPFGKALVEMGDAASGFFRTINTKPWAAFWTQNMMGDRMRSLMDGIHTMMPGTFAVTHDLLAGKTAMKVPAGALSPETYKRGLKEFGIKFNADDSIGIVRAAGKADIEKILSNKSNVLANLKDGEVSKALGQAQNKMSFLFDNFFRANQMTHRLQQGDSMFNAAKSARQAFFDYKDMSPVEQSIFRRFYMFYGYMSNATKSSLTDLMTNPGRITTQLHGSRAVMEMFSQPDAAPDLDTLDQQLLSNTTRAEQLNYFLGETEEGKPIFGKASFAPVAQVLQQFAIQQPRNVSVGELMDTTFDSAQRTIQKQFASANPFINFAAQAISGKNLYFDKPLSAEFLRTLPSLNSAAERISGLRYDELPFDLDAPAKAFLDAVPNGRGGLVADKNKMFIMMNLIPGLSRANSMARTLSNSEIPANLGVIRSLFGVNMDTGDLSRSFLSTRKENLENIVKEKSVGARKRLLEEEGL